MVAFRSARWASRQWPAGLAAQRTSDSRSRRTGTGAGAGCFLLLAGDGMFAPPLSAAAGALGAIATAPIAARSTYVVVARPRFPFPGRTPPFDSDRK